MRHPLSETTNKDKLGYIGEFWVNKYIENTGN